MAYLFPPKQHSAILKYFASSTPRRSYILFPFLFFSTSRGLMLTLAMTTSDQKQNVDLDSAQSTPSTKPS